MNLIITEIKGAVATILLNREDKRNALNEAMLTGLIEAFQKAEANESVRFIILRGNGQIFCAGADINWMKNAASNSYDQNLKEARLLAECFHKIYTCDKPVITIAHGAAFGGAVGLISASDIAIASHDTTFAFSEVKLGIVPSTIAPYVVRRIGEFAAKELMITGKKFNGRTAAQLGLINQSVFISELDNTLNDITSEMLVNGPEAMKACKTLINEVIAEDDWNTMKTTTAENIAAIRKTPEAIEGMSSFLEKRKPNWIN